MCRPHQSKGNEMTSEEIIRMAQESGLYSGSPRTPSTGRMVEKRLERFAAAVEQHLIDSGYRHCAEGQLTTQFCGQLEAAVKAEREACALVCDAFRDEWGGGTEGALAARDCANAIRARRKK